MRDFFRALIAYAKAFVIAPILARFDRGLDPLIGGFIKLDAKLDAFIARETRKRVALTAKRIKLLDAIDDIWDADYASAVLSEQASVIRNRIKEIVR